MDHGSADYGSTDHMICTCECRVCSRGLHNGSLRAIVVVPCAQSETEERGLSARQYLNLKKGLAMPRKTTDGASTIVATIDRWGILW